MINKEYRDEKAVKNAITKLHNGEYKMVRVDPAQVAPEAAEATEEVAEAEEVAKAEEASAEE
jgi:hypothetical protein